MSRIDEIRERAKNARKMDAFIEPGIIQLVSDIEYLLDRVTRLEEALASCKCGKWESIMDTEFYDADAASKKGEALKEE